MIALGQPLADSNLLSRGAVAAAIRIGPDVLELKSLKAQLDEANIVGDIVVASIATPKVNFVLEVDDLDLDRYLVRESSSSKTGKPVERPDNTGDDRKEPSPVTAEPPQQDASAPIDPEIMTLLQSLKLDGKLAIGRLKANGVLLQDVAVTAKGDEGLLSLTSATAKLYQGRLMTNLDLDLRQPKPHVRLENHVERVEIGELLHDLGAGDKFSGLTDWSMKLASIGLDGKSIRDNLSGTVSLQVDKGEIRGLDVVQKIRKLYAAATKGDHKASTAAAAADNTAFSKLTASATIKKGIIENRDLIAVSPVLHMTGAGTVDLVAKNVDYTLTADVYSALQGIDANRAEKLRGMTVPFRLKGPFSSLDRPTMDDVDYTGLIRSSLKTKLLEKGIEKLGGREKVIKALDRFEEKYGDNLPAKKLLKGLFGF